ncbi:hypothetical protein ACPW7J_03660 [Ihubacter sp. rT4E-8]|uniref:hypothetical protein n=1 Tax=Ihubacter sp. rT4E-8 TaxID=3242369 RepID=UPI003CF7C1CB
MIGTEAKLVLNDIKQDINRIYRSIVFLENFFYLTYDEILAKIDKMEDYHELADYIRFFIDKAELR